MLNFQRNTELVKILIESGWSDKRQVELPDYLENVCLSETQRSIFENLFDLELSVGKGRLVQFFFPTGNIYPGQRNLMNYFIDYVNEFSDEGCAVPENPVPLFQTNFDQVIFLYFVDSVGSLFSIGDEILKINSGIEGKLTEIIREWRE